MNIFPFENSISFRDSTVKTLQVENKRMFIKIVESLFNKYYNMEESERITLIKDGKEIDFEKNTLLISDLCRFELNERKVLNALYSKLEENLTSLPEEYLKLQNLYNLIINRVDFLLEDFDIETMYKIDFDFKSFFKVLDLKIYTGDSFSFLEKIYKIMDLNRELLANKLLIFINCKTYFTIEELEEIVKYGNYNKDNILFLESVEGDEITGEIKHIIDFDYCEFTEKT